jgi:hypothetical protein
MGQADGQRRRRVQGESRILIGKLQQLYGMSVDEAGQQIGELKRRVNQANQGAWAALLQTCEKLGTGNGT